MMTEKNRIAFITLFSLLIAVCMLFIPSADTVWADDNDKGTPDKSEYMLHALSLDEEAGEEAGGREDGRGLHRYKDTFMKNFELSKEQKKSTITDIEGIVNKVTTPEMSDLEKYYRLAIEANKIAEYDWDFWSGRYYLEYYSHQWDSYGVINEKSVCAGIAVFYSHLCHAADLPCLFLITDPDSLDHTISYIPDINGKAYYVDVTENAFLMSDKSNIFEPVYEPNFNCEGDTVDYKTHQITDCTDYTFDYSGDSSYFAIYSCSTLKDYYKDGDDVTLDEWLNNFDDYVVPFTEWLEDFGLHRNTEKQYVSDPYPYADKDDRHVSYYDYRSNFVGEGHRQAWFLEDFYTDPSELEAKILANKFDDQLVNVSGVKKNYDCDTRDELEEAVAKDINVEYFPSVEGGKVVAKTANLKLGEDYEVIYDNYDDETKTTIFKVVGIGDYAGTTESPNEYQIQVKTYSAVVEKAPVPKKNLVYTGKKQALIDPGEAAGGVMKYALGTKEQPPKDEEFKTSIPTATDAGDYYVWYRAVGDESHGVSDPIRLENPVKIDPISVNIVVDDELEIKVGETATITPKLDNGKIKAKFKFSCWDPDVATVDNNGVVTGVGGGYADIYIGAEFVDAGSNYEIKEDVEVRVKVVEPFDISETKVRFNEPSFTYNGKVQKPTIKTIKGRELVEGTDYTVEYSDPASKDAGTYQVIVTGIGDYIGSTDASYTIAKANNPMTLKMKTVKVKYKSLKKKSKSIRQTKAFTVSKKQGSLSYKLVSAKKGSKNFRNKFKINAKTGKVTVKKNLKKGTYKVKVKVKDKGTANYKASAWETVTFKVQVR